jgi:phosphate-selective porin OprO/OprP
MKCFIWEQAAIRAGNQGRNRILSLCCAAALLFAAVASEAVARGPVSATDMRRLPALGSPRTEFVPSPSTLPAPGREPEPESSENEADVAELLERIEALEHAVETRPEESPYLVRPSSSGATMTIRGRAQLDYWSFPDSSPGANILENGDPDVTPQDRFGFRRLRVTTQGGIFENMIYRTAIDFAGGEVSIKDAWFGFRELGPFDTVRLGNQPIPIGLAQMNSSRLTPFLERPEIFQAVTRGKRHLGVCSYGFSDDLRYNWRYGVFQPQVIGEQGVYVSDHYQLQAVGRLASTPWWDEASDGRGYLHLGVVGSAAHPDGSAARFDARAPNQARFRARPEARTTNRWVDTGAIAGASWYELLGVETALNLGAFRVVGEYYQTWLQRDPSFGSSLQFGGGYVYVAYFLTGEHQPWDRETGNIARVHPFENFFWVDTQRGPQWGWGAWQILARYSYADYNNRDIFGGVGRNLTIGLNWWWTPNSRMLLNWVHGRIDDRQVALAGAPALVGGDYDIIGVRFAIDH